MLRLKLSGVVVCLCNGNRSMQKFVIVSQLSSLDLFFFKKLEWNAVTTSGVDLVLVLVNALVPPMFHLGPCGNQILIMKFYKIKI